MFDKRRFSGHICKSSKLARIQNIEVIEFEDVSYWEKKLMTGLGVDGVLYRFEVVPRKAIPIIQSLSDGFSHKKSSDDKFKVPCAPLLNGDRAIAQFGVCH